MSDAPSEVLAVEAAALPLDSKRDGEPGRTPWTTAGRTFEAFQHRDYRYFWAGACLSNVGTWMQNVAQGWLVTQLTGSSFWVGMVGFAGGLPVLFLALPAGMMADRMDRRRLLLMSQTVVMFLAFGLAYVIEVSSLTRGNWGLMGWILGAAFVTGIGMVFSFPAWQAMIPDLVPSETLLNAVSLNSAQFHAARLVGPAIAGVLMARLGIASAFWANAVSFLAVIAALLVIRPRYAHPPHSGAGAAETTWQRLTGGLTYARENLSVAVLLASVSLTTFFGLPYLVLLPLLVKGPLRGDSGTYAFLVAANGLGALTGALGVAYLARLAHRPTLIRVGLIVFASAALAIALSGRVWLTACLMPVAGGAFLTMQAAVNTGIQASTPAHLRGRVMALFVLSFLGIMPLGSLAFGALGHVLGVRAAIAVGETACLAWGLVLLTRPKLLAALE
ncbi:MAG: MFS transporter [Deltaproteobacteria bacterium]|nr:MFS transporter [Deltaproteobacteria bacterium]